MLLITNSSISFLRTPRQSALNWYLPSRILRIGGITFVMIYLIKKEKKKSVIPDVLNFEFWKKIFLEEWKHPSYDSHTKRFIRSLFSCYTFFTRFTRYAARFLRVDFLRFSHFVRCSSTLQGLCKTAYWSSKGHVRSCMCFNELSKISLFVTYGG